LRISNLDNLPFKWEQRTTVNSFSQYGLQVSDNQTMSYLQRELSYVSMQSLVSLRDYCHKTRALLFSMCFL